jgi:hypothetical protein
MGWPRRRLLLAVGAVAAVLAGGVTVAVLAGREPAAPEPAAAVVHTGAEPAEQPNVAAVTRLLTGLPAAFAAGRKDGLTAAAAAQFADVRKALPAGSTVAVHADTWRRAGTIGSVGVTVTAPRSPPQSFVVLVTQEPSGWKVSGTQAAPSG